MNILIKIVHKSIDFKNLILYFFSCVLFVSIFVTLLAILNINSCINMGADLTNVKIVFSLYYILLAVIAFIFIQFAFAFYTKLRLQDYSLLLILGIRKVTLFLLVFLEYFTIYIFSYFIGLISGITLSEFISFIFRHMGYQVRLNLTDYIKISWTVLGLSLLLYIIGFLVICILLCFKSLSALLDENTKNERMHNRSSFLGIGGFLIILYSISFSISDSLLKLLLGISISILGVYMILSYGTSLIVLLIKKFGKSLYQKNLIPLNEFSYRFKSNKKIMFSVYLINFLVMFFVNALCISTLIPYDYSKSYPYEGIAVYDSNTSIPNDVYSIPLYKGYLNDYEDEEQEFLYCITQKNYIDLTGNNIKLKNDECILILQSATSDEMLESIHDISILSNGQEYKFLIKNFENQIITGEELPNMFCIGILPDTFGENAMFQDKKMVLFNSEDIVMNDFFLDYPTNEKYIRSEIAGKIKNDNLTILVSSIIIGIFSVICCMGIISIRSLSGINNLKKRYELLMYLGMTEPMKKKFIFKEYKIILTIPMIFAFILSLCFLIIELQRSRILNFSYFIFLFLFQCIICLIEMFYFGIVKKNLLTKITI